MKLVKIDFFEYNLDALKPLSVKEIRAMYGHKRTEKQMDELLKALGKGSKKKKDEEQEGGE